MPKDQIFAIAIALNIPLIVLAVLSGVFFDFAVEGLIPFGITGSALLLLYTLGVRRLHPLTFAAGALLIVHAGACFLARWYLSSLA
ncbi:MAG: hypothetical protein RLY93_08320 [Sumerlaeia bacterium]